MGMEMTTTLWIVLAIVGLELGSFVSLWGLYRLQTRRASRLDPRPARLEPARERSSAQTATPPAA
jgi:hypothetical protein